MITSIQMSESSPVNGCQISESKPVHRFQGYHQYTEVRVITRTQISESRPYKDVRFMTSTEMSVITFKQLSESSAVERYQSYHECTDVRYHYQNQYTDSRVMTNTQRVESSTIHRYQSLPVNRFQNDHQ